MQHWKKYILYPRYFWVMMLVSFLTIWGYGAQRVLVPVQMQHIGTDVLVMGVLIALFGLPRAVMNIVGGHLSDRFSKKYNMLISVAIFGVISILLIGLSHSSWAIGLWRMLLAVGISWGTTAILAYLAGITMPEIRGRAFGLQKMFTWLGITLAGFVSPFLLTKIGMNALMMLMALIGGIGLLFLFFFVNDVPIRDEENHPSEHKKDLRTQKEEPEVRDRSVKYAEGSNQSKVTKEKVLLSYNGMVMKVVEDGIVTFFFPIYILLHYQDVVIIGTVISLFTLVYVFFQPIGGWLADWFGSWRVMAIGFLLLVIMTGILLLFQNLCSLYLFTVVAGCGSGMAVTSAEMRASFIGSRHEQGRTLGYWRFYRDMGSFVGPILVGVLLTFSHVQLLLVTLFALCLAALVMSGVHIFAREG